MPERTEQSAHRESWNYDYYIGKVVRIRSEICDYAVENDMEPDDTLSTVADNLKAILEISTFNGWKGSEVGNE